MFSLAADEGGTSARRAALRGARAIKGASNPAVLGRFSEISPFSFSLFLLPSPGFFCFVFFLPPSRKFGMSSPKTPPGEDIGATPNSKNPNFPLSRSFFGGSGEGETLRDWGMGSGGFGDTPPLQFCRWGKAPPEILGHPRPIPSVFGDASPEIRRPKGTGIWR